MKHDDIEFILVKGGVKNINLRVTHDGTVRVSVPRRMPLEKVLNFISEKKEWIIEHKDKIFPRDGYILYLGQQIPVSELSGQNPEEFLAKESFDFLTKRYNYLCETLGISNAPTLELKPLRGKYGYYTKGIHEICLNSLLIMVPLECIDYVIVHELVHIKHFDHGKEFHTELQKIIPNERELRNKLGKYILW